MPELNLPTEARQIDTNDKVTGIHERSIAINRDVGSDSDTASATGSVHAKLKDIKAAIPSISTSVIKSIQKGVVSTGGTSLAQYNVTIAQINPNKAFVLIDGSKDAAYGGAYPLTVTSVTASQVVIKPTYNDVNYGYNFSWQVIEFY